MSTNQTPNSDAEQRHDARPDEAGKQDALRASELRYRRLFESAKDGILILDAETGIITDVNPFMINLLGYSREFFLTKRIWELGFLGDAIANEDKFGELQAKGYVRYEDLPLETSDGRRIEDELRDANARKRSRVKGRSPIPYVLALAAMWVLCLTGSALGQNAPAPTEETPQQVRIGVLAKRGVERCMEKWEPTADYLTAEIPGYAFSIVPLGFDEFAPTVERGEVDFILSNPALYLSAIYDSGAGCIARLVNRHLDQGYTYCAGLIFTRADRGDIKQIADLKGKTFMAVSEQAFYGWHVVWHALKENGFDPHRDFAELRFGGTNDAVVNAVLNGEVDAGCVRSNTLERMAAEGAIQIDAFRVLDSHEEERGLPFLHSTRHYPEWPFAKLPHIPRELSDKVAVALLSMPAESPAAQAARCLGWTIGGNYLPVRECLQALRVAPFEDYGKVTLGQALRQHRDGVLAIFGSALVSVAFGLYALRSKRLIATSTNALHRSEEQYRAVAEETPGMICRFLPSGEITYANQAYCKYFGKRSEELVGSSFLSLIPEADRDAVMGSISVMTVESPKQSHEHQVIGRDGDIRWQRWTNGATFDAKGQPISYQSIGEDITKRKRAEEERETTIELLGLLNAKNDLHGLMRLVIRFMTNLSGCEAVGIRLRDGDDFPYYETSGFSEEFVELERSLCVADLNGQVLRDETGNPVLECMCGNIICGRFDPTKSFFTDHGSFVSNCTTELLASTTEEDRQARTRNRCNGEGYESVFLIPLRAVGETFGLMQFNDRRKNAFSSHFGELAERLADSVGIALAQRQAEKALKENLERLKGFDLHSSEGVYRVDMTKPVPTELAHDAMVRWINEHAIVGEANDALAQMYGFKPQDMIGCPATQFAPEYGERAVLVLQAKDYRVINQETEDVDDDGNPLYLIENYHGIVEDGHLLAIWGAQRDITERKRAEEALRKSEERLRIVSGATTDLVYEWDVVSNTLEWFGDLDGVLGYEPDEIEKTIAGWVSLIHPADRAQLADSVERHRTSTELIFEVYRIRRKDGSWVWWEDRGTPILSPIGVPVEWIGSCTDITERKQAEEELRNANMNLALAVKASGIGPWNWDLRTDKVYFSTEWKRQIGYDEDEIADRYEEWETRLHPEDRDRVVAGLKEYLSGQAAEYEVHFRLRHKDGSYRHIFTRGEMVRDENGEPLRMLGCHVDITEHRRLEEDYRRLFQEMIDAFALHEIICDDKGVPVDYRFLSVNPAFERMTGLKAHDITGKTVLEILPATEPYWIETYGKVALTGEPVAFENYSKELEKHFDVTAFRPAPDQFACIFMDITERKRAEEELRKSRTRLVEAQRIARMGDFTWEVENGKVTWSEGMYELLGYDKSENIDYNTVNAEVHHPDDLERITNWLNECLDSGKSDHPPNEYRLIRKDGKVLDVVTTIFIAHKDSKPVTMVGTCMDITNIRQLQIERRQSEETYRSLLTSLNAGVVVHAPDTSILIANPAASEILGLSMDQMMGKTAMDPQWKFLSEDGSDMPLDEYPVNRVLSTNEPLHNQVVGVDRPRMGDVAWVLVNGFPAYQESGQLEQIVINFVDITERKRAEIEKEKLENQLRQAQKMEAVGRLAGGVAHDFNNMLGVILGHAEMILEEMDPDQPFYADLMEIYKSGERSADLTRQLLAFARKQTVAPKVIDLNQTVEGMLKMLHRLIGEDIDMAWIPSEAVWPVRIDPAQIDQILANLCVNARDAIADVGKVTFETDNEVFDEDYCKEHAGFLPGEYTMLTVSDNGCGMDTETLEKVFEPFFTTKESGKGTGLGLATVYGAVKQNNGFINVYSDPGQGTTFKIYLPRHAAKAAETKEPRPQAAERGSETILLVEDELAILKMTTRILERTGYKVLAAGTPGEALTLAREHAGGIHLLMTDVVMPEMNGRDLARNLLSLYPDLKRLFMSGYTANVIAHHGVLDEGVHFIQKPFSIGDLTVKVREALEG